MENTIHYLELSKNPIRFDVASQLTSVFFDDSNKQVNSSINLSKVHLIGYIYEEIKYIL